MRRITVYECNKKAHYQLVSFLISNTETIYALEKVD